MKYNLKPIIILLLFIGIMSIIIIGLKIKPELTVLTLVFLIIINAIVNIK